MFFLFKQKSAYEMRISDWSSDVCSSDLGADFLEADRAEQLAEAQHFLVQQRQQRLGRGIAAGEAGAAGDQHAVDGVVGDPLRDRGAQAVAVVGEQGACVQAVAVGYKRRDEVRSAEHKSELQSLMRVSYAVFCL